MKSCRSSPEYLRSTVPSSSGLKNKPSKQKGEGVMCKIPVADADLERSPVRTSKNNKRNN
jgi:hypothetical protein